MKLTGGPGPGGVVHFTSGQVVQDWGVEVVVVVVVVGLTSPSPSHILHSASG
jgi:hypothetical protein